MQFAFVYLTVHEHEILRVYLAYFRFAFLYVEYQYCHANYFIPKDLQYCLWNEIFVVKQIYILIRRWAYDGNMDILIYILLKYFSNSASMKCQNPVNAFGNLCSFIFSFIWFINVTCNKYLSNAHKNMLVSWNWNTYVKMKIDVLWKSTDLYLSNQQFVNHQFCLFTFGAF